MNSKYESAEYQNAVSDFVRREVYHCMSGLVHTLATYYGERVTGDLSDLCEEAFELSDLCEEAFELSTPIDDWEEAAIGEGWECDGLGWTYNNPETGELLREATAQGACEDHDIEPYRREIYEHWIVSDWLAEKLEAKGERVGPLGDLTIWGRTTTGQAIMLDRVICDIYDEVMEVRNADR